MLTRHAQDLVADGKGVLLLRLSGLEGRGELQPLPQVQAVLRFRPHSIHDSCDFRVLVRLREHGEDLSVLAARAVDCLVTPRRMTTPALPQGGTPALRGIPEPGPGWLFQGPCRWPRQRASSHRAPSGPPRTAKWSVQAETDKSVHVHADAHVETFKETFKPPEKATTVVSRTQIRSASIPATGSFSFAREAGICVSGQRTLRFTRDRARRAVSLHDTQCSGSALLLWQTHRVFDGGPVAA